MDKLLLQTSLKVVTMGFDDEFRIENVDSILVTRIRRFLNRIHNQKAIKINYSDDGKQENTVISFFRGFSPSFDYEDTGDGNFERAKADYFQKLFVVGEKGPAYRENITYEGIGPYFKNNPNIKDLNELLLFVNTRLERNNFGSIEMSELLSSIKNDLVCGYMFLLNLCHNIGGAWEDKARSPFVSGAYGEDGFKKALQFARGRQERKYSYIIWGFIRKNDDENYVIVKELAKRMGTLEVQWYEDIHSEIIIKDGIFPHNILGVFVIDNETNSKEFIINPFLYQLFHVNKSKSKYQLSGLTEYVCQNGLPIDQNDFEICASSLGYQSYGYRLRDGYIRAGALGDEPNQNLPRNYDFL
ncbi:hypothetical protein [Enterococcus hermanniensis]|uniref:Uncharacterized protein n=1 Tax=Enterococcus hermanniensis TaxID=249189 RepID=A0A1L8TNY6_9ENTE|nr:hypothetical protein [Enterococcus hermanniensis]OJG46026.1 hypothetical protein RV04_GL001792 [Enterococcus hermanniensis]